MRQRVILSFFLFLVVGVLVAKTIVPFVGVYERTQTSEGEFESEDPAVTDLIASGKTTASMIMGFYDQNGQPIREDDSLSTLYQSGTTQEIKSFKATIISLKVGGENIDLNTLFVEVQYILLAAGKEYWIDSSQYRRANFEIVGDERRFTATGIPPPGGGGLQVLDIANLGDDLGVPYHVKGFQWTFIVRFQSSAEDLNGNPVFADLKQKSMSIITDVAPETGTLSLNIDVRQASVTGLFEGVRRSLLSFVIIVFFLALWWWKGKDLANLGDS